MAKVRKALREPITDAAKAFTVFDESVQSWLQPLDLHRWVIELHWDEKEEEWASCVAEFSYKRATVCINPTNFAKEAFTPLHIESVAVHELVHALIWPGYNELANPQIPVEVRSIFEELAADQLAHAMMMAKYESAEEVQALWHGYRVFPKAVP